MEAIRSYKTLVKYNKLINCKVLPSREDIIATLPQGSVCAEVGIKVGNFASSILKLNKPKELTLVDLDMFCIDKCKKRFARRNNIKYVHGDSKLVLKEFQDNYFDWVFLDTDHSYNTTKIELEQADRIVKEDGMIIIHDYIASSYYESKYSSYSENIPYGVIPAVNEFVNNSVWEFKYITLEPSMYIAVALTKNINGESFRRII